MATRRTTRSSSRKPQWLVIASGIATLVNALVRLFGLFRSKSKTTTTRSTGAPAPAQRRPPVSSAPSRRSNQTPAPPVEAPAGPVGTDGGIPVLFKNKQSDRIVQASGTVVKVLPDDEDTLDVLQVYRNKIFHICVVEPVADERGARERRGLHVVDGDGERVRRHAAIVHGAPLPALGASVDAMADRPQARSG